MNRYLFVAKVLNMENAELWRFISKEIVASNEIDAWEDFTNYALATCEECECVETIKNIYII